MEKKKNKREIRHVTGAGGIKCVHTTLAFGMDGRRKGKLNKSENSRNTQSDKLAADFSSHWVKVAVVQHAVVSPLSRQAPSELRTSAAQKYSKEEGKA